MGHLLEPDHRASTRSAPAGAGFKVGARYCSRNHDKLPSVSWSESHPSVIGIITAVEPREVQAGVHLVVELKLKVPIQLGSR